MLTSREDFTKLLERLKDKIGALFPVSGELNTVSVSDLHWSGVGEEIFGDPDIHKRYKTTGRTLAARLLGSVKVVAKDGGKLLDSAQNHPIVSIPHLTSKQSFIVQGKEVQVVSQIRLRPGTYTRYTADNNVETFINAAGGGYRVQFDRLTKIFRIRVGQSLYVYLYPILKGLGVTDAELRRVWGDEILGANRAYDRPGELSKLYRKMRPFAVVPKDQDELAREVKAFFQSKSLDPDITRLTLGAAYATIEPKVLVASSQRALQLARGETKADDTENLAYKSLHSVDDFVVERIEKNIPAAERSIRYMVDRRPRVIDVLPPSLFTKPVMQFFSTSEFARYSDQNNPLDMVGVQSLVTSMGEGGISSIYAVSDQLRALHPSHIGVLDPLHTPESSRIGITTHLALGARKMGNSIGLTVISAKTGAQETKRSVDLEKVPVAFYDEYDHTAKPPKPRAAQVKARVDGELKMVAPSTVQYIFPHPARMYGFLSNAVPYINTNSPNRVLMASRHIEQAVPLADPDVPLVQAKFGARGYESATGRLLVPKAPSDGTVIKIVGNIITLRGDDGKTQQIKLHDNYPLNSSAFLHEKSIVQVGQRVKKDQPLADSDFTRNGELAIGKTLKVAYLPYKGYNFEDGIVVSESAAKKLTSVHKHELTLNLDANIRVGLDVFLAHFPTTEKIDRSKYGPDGVVKKGAVLTLNEPAIPAVRQIKVLEEFDYAKLHKSLRSQWQDASVRWDGHFPAEVIDVVKTRSFIAVYVKTHETLEIGDKLCYTPDHQVLTMRGWIPIGDVRFDDMVATLNAKGEIEYQSPTRLFSYDVDESLYYLESQQVSLFVTRNHDLYVQRRGKSRFERVQAEQCFGKRVRHKKRGVWKQPSVDEIEVPGYSVRCGRGGVSSKKVDGVVFPADDLLRLVGFFIAEGWLASGPDHRVEFCQVKASGRRWFEALCRRLGLHVVPSENKYILYSRHLYEWLRSCGTGSTNKQIPSELLMLGRENLLALWEGLLIGDGSTIRSGSVVYHTSSDKLADQVQELALKVGWSANKQVRKAPSTFIKHRGKLRLIWPTTDRKIVRIVKSKCEPTINHGHTRKQRGQTEQWRRYLGKVFCIEVPNHVLYVRRNGKPVWCGNSSRHGGKGVVTLILPDNEMYRDEGGSTVDVLFNPSGVLGRANPGQYFEAAAGKVAVKTGKPVLVQNYDGKDTLEQVQQMLRSAGLNEGSEETLIDPTTNRPVERIQTGNLHFMKLRHQVSKKLSARGVTTYTHDETPARAPQANPMKIGTMELYSLLSSGGTAFLRDAATIKAQRNDDFWTAVQLGLPTPPTKTPFIVDKFTAYMKGAGINLQQEGNKLKALPLTDKDILAQSNGEIHSPGVVRANDLAAEPGGLFDRGLTGGFGGVYWNHIALSDPIPNPLMDQAIITVLGTPTRPFRKAELDGLLNGSLFVTPDGRFTTEAKGNMTGGEAIRHLLSKIDVDAEISKLQAALKTFSGSKRDFAIKKIRYLKVLKKTNLSPVHAYTNTLVPVVPARMRPIYPNPDGSLNVADPIHGYREVLMVNNQIKDLKTLGVDDKNLAPLRGQLYAAVRGLVGLQEPLTRSQNFKGFIATIKGQQNKFGLFQGRVLSRRQDLTGRSTIIPDPKLGLDEAKIPEEMAFTIYKPFIVQKLVSLGQEAVSARDLVEKKDPLARTALEAVIKERPLLLNRAPSLHKFSILAFRPQLTTGKAVEINPLVVKGFNADFDGDAMMVHVPVSEAARSEAAERLLPSRNLFSPRDNSVIHSPSMEMILGIYLMTTPKGTPMPAASESSAVSLYKTGKIRANQAVKVRGKIITPGQVLFNEIIPSELRPGNVPIDKKKLMALVADIARKKPAIAGEVLSRIKDMGNHYVTEIGWSFSLNDLHFSKSVRNKVIEKAEKDAKRVGFDRAFVTAAKTMESHVRQQTDNRAVIGGPLSGAFGKAEMVTQMIASPVAVTDHEGKVTQVPIKKSFAEGMDMGSYWALIPGARKGLMDRTLSTADTGAFGKSLVAATVDTTISMRDCGTTEGLDFAVTDPEAMDRVVARGPYKGKTTDPQMIRNLQARGVKTLTLRSPLRCRAVRGVCAMCFGPLENGQFPSIGYHVGTLAGQTISEPATQMTMKAFHTGGAVGGASIGYPRLKQILEMPTNVKGKAVLAMTSGKVEQVVPSAAGGWNVLVGGLHHFVPKEMGLAVKRGQRVSAGDLLSSGGAVRPQDLLAATNDIRRVQDRMIQDMGSVFSDARLRVKRKIFETAIHPLTTRAEVLDPGDADAKFGLLQGDVLSVNNITAMNDKLKKQGKRPIEYAPTLLSIKKAPYYTNDFIGQLVAERPHQTLKAAPGLAAVSDIGPSGHPIATYAFGKYFGTKVRENDAKTASLDDVTWYLKECEALEREGEPLPDEVQDALRQVQALVGHSGNDQE